MSLQLKRRERLQNLGLIRESGHQHFSGSLVLPVFTVGGKVGEIYGRKIIRNLRKGTCQHLFLPGPHEGIWNIEALEEPEVILCEAPLDALTFWVQGFRNVTFIYGTDGFTEEIFEALLERGVRRVQIAYDADEEGNRAAEQDAERLKARGIEVYRIRFPWGMDANEYARKMPPATQSLDAALRAAEWTGGAKAPTPTGTAPKTAPENSAPQLSAAPIESALEPPKSSEPLLERVGEYHFLRLGQREYRVGGLQKNNSLEVMKVALRLRRGEDFHLDSFDMTRDGERRNLPFSRPLCYSRHHAHRHLQGGTASPKKRPPPRKNASGVLGSPQGIASGNRPCKSPERIGKSGLYV